MPDFLLTISDFIRDWGIERFIEIVIGVAGLIVLLFFPMGDVDYSSAYDGINFALVQVAAGVMLVVAVPMIWRGPVDWIYSFAFCVVVGVIASLRWLILGQRSVVLIKASDRTNLESVADAKGSKSNQK